MTDTAVMRPLERRTVVALGRSLPDQERLERHATIFSDHAATTLARRHAEIVEESARLAAASPDLENGARLLAGDVREALAQALISGLERPVQTHVTVPVGPRCIGPPYDQSWSDGLASAFGADQDGDFWVMTSDGSSGAGVGLYLTVDEPVDAAITPNGTYQFGGMAANWSPALRSTGGLGITVYIDGDPQPAYSRQVALWNVTGTVGMNTASAQGAQFGGLAGNGQIADAASPPSGFGPVPLAPMIIRMDPAHQYLVWVWAWQVSHHTDGFLCMLNVKLPCVMVSAGPPLVLH